MCLRQRYRNRCMQTCMSLPNIYLER
ncbi:hypothetical protein RSAG8_12730, partial [Rhizoctonia solani AG-8 WAC10335]